jgi:HEAT repeat protein
VWRIEGKAGEVVPLLVKWLDEQPSPTRKAVAAALGEIGPDAKDGAFGVLVEVYRGDPNLGVRAAAGAALKKIDAKAAATLGVR